MDNDQYRIDMIDMKNEELYNIVHKIRRTFIDDLGDNQESLILEDEKTDIYILYFANEPICTARIHKKPEGWKIERVASLKEHRNKGHTKYLIEYLIKHKIEPFKTEKEIIYLYGQTHATGFYLKCQFVIHGELFLDEDNIEHYKFVYTPAVKSQ